MLGATTAIASLVRLHPVLSQGLMDLRLWMFVTSIPFPIGSMHAVFTYIYHKIKQM